MSEGLPREEGRGGEGLPEEELAETPTVGVRVMAPWTNGKLYPGKVSRVTGAGVVTILFDDGDKREGVAWTACTARATDTDRFGLSRQWSESLRTWYARKTSEEKRPLCSKMAAWNFLAAALFFNLWGDVPSGCAFAVLMGSLLFANIGNMRAGRALHGLGLLLLAVAFVLISMKTHRVTSIPDPTCEPWAGSCQEGVSAPTGASSATTAPTRYPRAWTSTGIGGPRGAPGTSQLEILAHTGVGEGQDA